jgi:hypothetical protein
MGTEFLVVTMVAMMMKTWAVRAARAGMTGTGTGTVTATVKWTWRKWNGRRRKRKLTAAVSFSPPRRSC